MAFWNPLIRIPNRSIALDSLMWNPFSLCTKPLRLAYFSHHTRYRSVLSVYTMIMPKAPSAAAAAGAAAEAKMTRAKACPPHLQSMLTSGATAYRLPSSQQYRPKIMAPGFKSVGGPRFMQYKVFKRFWFSQLYLRSTINLSKISPVVVHIVQLWPFA